MGTTHMQIHLRLRTVRRRFRALAPVVLLCAFPIHAQQPSPAISDTLSVAPVQEEISLKNNRLFYVLANYTTVENLDHFGPLSAKTKFKLSMKTMSDPITISFIGMIALLGQARNSDPSYGQGFQGYAKRYGTFYADTAIGTLMTTSVFP